MFINYVKNEGLSINTYRKPSCMIGSLDDVLEAYENDSESVCSSVEPGDLKDKGFVFDGFEY